MLGSSWWGKLKKGVQKSTSKFASDLKGVFKSKKVDEETLKELEDLMIMHDFGIQITDDLIQKVKKQKFESGTDISVVQEFLYEQVLPILTMCKKGFNIDDNLKPSVLLVLGVNGAGKTTTIAKLAHLYKSMGRQVSVCAADTFRAAAVEQMAHWCEKIDVPLYKADQEGADPAGLCFDALKQSRDKKDDLLIIDTAGRLHNKSQLMDELKKMKRVLQKIDATAPHTSLLVLDGTTGQNAVKQVETFSENIGIDWLVINKLDSTAKGGVTIQIAERFRLPIMGIGLGERLDDFEFFDPETYTKNLLGID